MHRIIRRLALLALALAAGTVAAEPPINAVPALPAPPLTKAAPARLLLDSAPAREVALPQVSAAELAALRARNATPPGTNALQRPALKKVMAIGLARDVPAAGRTIDLAALDWQDAGNGVRAAHVEVRSPDAEAVRVAIAGVPGVPGLAVRFAGTAAGATVFGPYPQAQVQRAIDRFGAFWSPLLPGDSALIELAVPAQTTLAGRTLVLPRMSHALVAPGELRKVSPKRLQDIGLALPCEVDVRCVVPASPAYNQAVSAVAKIAFNRADGTLILCSGQVLNDSANDGVPYFFTANHCVHTADEAASVNTFWFFEATACGNDTVRPDWVQQAQGAELLAGSPDWDWTLLRLGVLPPAGVSYAAWRSEAILTGSNVVVLHHPLGDLKKIARGTSAGFIADEVYDRATPATFVYVTYTDGLTEGGSSGSGLLVQNPLTGQYEVRGGLYNGTPASCPVSPGYYDSYSRLDSMVPQVREYLTPGNNPGGTVPVVEFYNAALDHYFITASAQEIRDLDSGVHAGWERTGLRFQAYASPQPGTRPVCRYYRTPGYGNSHFYSASVDECAATKAQHPLDWIYESPAVFYVALPDQASGRCPTATQPLWRFFNPFTVNHRYTAEVKVRDALRDDPARWIAEGYGPDAVIMCSPVGG